MYKDCVTITRTFPKCQMHASIHVPPEPLHSVGAYWAFQVWGLDFVRPIHPLSSERHRFILTAVEYFSKWAEAVAIRRQIGDCVAQFIKENIIRRFGVPQKIITDNGLPFLGWRTAEMMEQFRIKKMEASPYTAQSKLNL